MGLIFILGSLSGCLRWAEEDNEIEEPNHWLPPVEDRADMIYEDTDVFSRVSKNGSYDTDDVLSVFVPVPEIDASDGGAGVTGGAEVHLGLWLPVIDGCDWSSSDISED
ncbi:MAG: hypothetical protein CMA02_02850, partial [Euryarchaeota archaeon]|nr:hypothetical protein [Euryarchaeota archaeon]